MSTKINLGIHWFRRDLRLIGNPGLRHNWKLNNGKVLGLFCFDGKFLAREDFSHNRFALFLNRLSELKNELQNAGGDLLVLNALPKQSFSSLLKNLNAKFKINLVTYCRDYEPFARARDAEIDELLQSLSVPCETFRDHLVFEPGEIVKENDKSPYQIYSPFARQWLSKISEKNNLDRLSGALTGASILKKNNHKPESIFDIKWSEVLIKGQNFPDSLEEFIKKNSKHVSVAIPEVSTKKIATSLDDFATKIKNYGRDRDIPSLLGTSRFSIYFKNGSLTTAQVMSFFELYKNLNFKSDSGEVKFLKELIWREFYYHILYFFPRVENEAFIEKFKKIKWQNNEKYFEAWKEGKTGFPIVDAGMRELKQTGWMHNRVRMIVASFLTKDLLIDWRWGEQYFMKYLLDGDLAPNNGGWQWAASTGCDPQPYFRVFNPWLQSKKFDPEGEYIKKYIPELAKLDKKAVHEPHLYGGAKGYPEPIVEHSSQRQKALTLYQVES